MPISIDARLKVRLIELLADQLRHSFVWYDSYIFDAGGLNPGEMEASFPIKGNLRMSSASSSETTRSLPSYRAS